MADIGQLLDKLEANLTSIYDKLESKGVQVSGNKNLDNLVLAIDNIGGGSSSGEDKNLLKEKVVIDLSQYENVIGGDVEYYGNGSLGLEIGKTYVIKYKIDGKEGQTTAIAEDVGHPYLFLVDSAFLGETSISDNVIGIDEDYNSILGNGFQIITYRTLRNEDSVIEFLSITKVETDIITDLYEFSSVNEMEAFKTEKNLGKYAKYVGETTDTYTNGSIYYLIKQGGNIALFDEKSFISDVGAYVVSYEKPLENTFVSNSSVNINFKVNGGELQTFVSTFIEADGMQMIGFDLENQTPTIIYQDDKITVMFVGYFNFDMMTSKEGQSYMAMIMDKATGNPDLTNVLEIVSFSNETTEVVNPVIFNYKPYRYLNPLTATPATEKDIALGREAYNKNGEIISGTRENPIKLTTIEEVQELLSQNFNDGVYKIDGVEGYEYGLYQYTFNGLQRLYALYSLENQATSKDIFQGKQAFGGDGTSIAGDMRSPKEIETEAEMEELLTNDMIEDTSVFKFIGSDSNKYHTRQRYSKTLGSVNFSAYRTFIPIIAIDEIGVGMEGLGYNYGELVLRMTKLIQRPYAYAGWTEIGTVDIANDQYAGSNSAIAEHAFYKCIALSTFIIRSSTNDYVIPLNGEILEGTQIADKNGYIYVPDSLVEQYKTAQYWSTHADVIKPLSELEE